MSGKKARAGALGAAGEVVAGAEDLCGGDLLRLRLDQGEAGVKVEELG